MSDSDLHGYMVFCYDMVSLAKTYDEKDTVIKNRNDLLDVTMELITVQKYSN